MDFKTWLTIFQTVGVFAAGIGFMFSQVRKGRIDGTIDTIALQNSRITALEADNKGKTTQIDALNTEISALKTLLMNKDKENDRLVAIFQNRNPEFQKVLSVAMEAEVFFKNSAEEHKKIIELLQSTTLLQEKLLKQKGVK